MLELKALWKSSTHSKQDQKEDDAAFERFLVKLSGMEVPDDCDSSEQDFVRGHEKALALIEALKRCQVVEIPAKEKRNEEKRKHEQDPQDPHSKKLKNESKKMKSITAQTYSANFLKFVVRVSDEKYVWKPKILNPDDSVAFQQMNVYWGKYFLRRVENRNPPSSEDDMFQIADELLHDFMEIFVHAPPVALIRACFNKTPDNLNSLWKRWCEQAGMPAPKIQQKRKRELGNREMRYELWTAAYECAWNQGASAETAAAAGAKADLYGRREDVGLRKQEGKDVWYPQVQELAAKFAAEAMAEAGGRAGAGASAAAAEAAGVRGELWPCYSSVSAYPSFLRALPDFPIVSTL